MDWFYFLGKLICFYVQDPSSRWSSSPGWMESEAPTEQRQLGPCWHRVLTALQTGMRPRDGRRSPVLAGKLLHTLSLEPHDLCGQHLARSLFTQIP